MPTIFVSPWITPNTVIRSGEPGKHFDHTSWLATLLDWFDLDPALLGERTKQAPKFDAVIGDVQRGCSTLPAPWDCSHADGARPKQRISVGFAAEVARVVAGKKRSKRPMKVLRKLTRKCKRVGDLTDFYRDA